MFLVICTFVIGLRFKVVVQSAFKCHIYEWESNTHLYIQTFQLAVCQRFGRWIMGISPSNSCLSKTKPARMPCSWWRYNNKQIYIKEIYHMFSSPNIWLISLMLHLFNNTLRTIMPETSQSYTFHSLDLVFNQMSKKTED